MSDKKSGYFKETKKDKKGHLEHLLKEILNLPVAKNPYLQERLNPSDCNG